MPTVLDLNIIYRSPSASMQPKLKKIVLQSLWKFLKHVEGYASLINSALEDVPELPGT
jgi:hypothetical protein